MISHPTSIVDPLPASASSPVAILATLTIADVVAANGIASAEVQRRRQAASRHSNLKLVARIAAPWLSLTVAFLACVALLVSKQLDAVSQMWAAVVSYMPFFFLTLIWVFLMRMASQAAQRRAFRRLVPFTWPGIQPSGSMVRLRLGSNAIEVKTSERLVEAVCAQGCSAVETVDAFTLVINDIAIPIPKRGLDLVGSEAIRIRLNTWNLREEKAGFDTPTRVRIQAGLATILGTCGLVLTHQAILHASPPPAQVSIRPSSHVVLINNERAQVTSEFYNVGVRNGNLDEQMGGYFKIPAVHGGYNVGRHASGYSARSPEEEKRLLDNPSQGFLMPSDAIVTSLPQRGALIFWTRAISGGNVEFCAAHTTHRDPLPSLGTPFAFRRYARVWLCSKVLPSAELATWLEAISATFDADFVARTQQ